VFGLCRSIWEANCYLPRLGGGGWGGGGGGWGGGGVGWGVEGGGGGGGVGGGGGNKKQIVASYYKFKNYCGKKPLDKTTNKKREKLNKEVPGF